MYHFHLNALLSLIFFPPKQMSVYSRRFIFCAVFLPHTQSFIWVTIWVPGRKWGGVDSASNYPTSFWKEKMLSVFKQLVHVAIASASLLHFPVSERQMNRNDCFVLLCSHFSKLHKTYISSLPCAFFVSAKREEKRRDRDTWIRNCCANKQTFLLFFSALVC